MARLSPRPLKADKFARVSSILLRDKRLSTRDKMVYVALCEFQDPSGRCWPSVNSLSTISGLGRTAIHEALVVLQSLGYIERQLRNATSNYYVLSTVPLSDLFDSDGNGEDGHVSLTDPPSAPRPSGGYVCSPGEQFACPDSGLWVFDERTGKLRLADDPRPHDELKEEKEIERLKELWNEALPMNPSGIEKPEQRRAFNLYWRHSRAEVGTIENLIAMVKKSPFLQGQNERYWKASLFWFLKNREKILQGRYTAYQTGGDTIEVEF